MRMNKPPISESKIFLLITTPILMLEVIMAPQLFGSGFGGFCLTSLLILTTVIFGMRISRRWFQRLNRPAFNLLRAMDFETATGYVVIPEEIRISKLFMFILSRRPPAFQDRMLKIVDSKETFKGDWKPKLPDFSSHISDEDPFWKKNRMKNSPHLKRNKSFRFLQYNRPCIRFGQLLGYQCSHQSLRVWSLLSFDLVQR